MRERAEVDYPRLSLYLRVLGVPNRLELLKKLQLPHPAGGIGLTPARRDARNPERPISRQAVEAHLRKLVDLGLVHEKSVDRDGRTVREFVVNHARLFVLVDELRRLTLIRPIQSDRGETVGRQTSAGVPETLLPPGPALVLANGPMEGLAFALDGVGPWTLGREKGLPASLPYDPFVSKQNTRLFREGGSFFVEAIAGARNGTRLNWRPLAPGERAPLSAGDAVGVGRSLLFVRGI